MVKDGRINKKFKIIVYKWYGFIEYSVILEKVKDFLFENYIYVIIFFIITCILLPFSKRKERMIKRKMERLELEQQLKNIIK